MKNMTPEKIDGIMTTLINKMEVNYSITYWGHNENRVVCGRVLLYKNNETVGYWSGYHFYFQYESGILIPIGDDTLIPEYDLFKVLPPKLVNTYFSDKVKEFLYRKINTELNIFS